MESQDVLNNECVKNLTKMVNDLTIYYNDINTYARELESSDKSEQLKSDIKNRKFDVTNINIALTQAAYLNEQIEGQYTKVRDIVNKALKEKTSEVTITANDRKYGGCTVSIEHAQAILDEMQDQKNKAEIMADYIFQTYNDILVASFGDIFLPKEKVINAHCVKDAQYNARKTAYDRVLVPMTKKLYEHQGRDESELHYKARKWLRNNGAVYATDSLQTFTDAIYDYILKNDDLYDAFINGGNVYELIAESDIIKRNIIADNCYKTLTEAEYNWVIREVDVRIKKDSVDVYKIPNASLHFERVTTLLTRLLFGYGYHSKLDPSDYIKETNRIINKIDIHDMKILMAIPETCIFTFPTDTDSAYIQTVTTEVIRHCVDYNQNWELDAAYMYWFWTYLQGKEYTTTKDQTGADRDPPKDHPDPYDYFNKVFKPKLKKIAEVTSLRLVGTGGILIDSSSDNHGYNHNSLKLIAPWLATFFPESTLDPRKRNQHIEYLIDIAKGFKDVRLFVDWIHDNIMLKVPIEVIKSFNAISGLQYLTDIPFAFVPNNFSLFDPEYEFETGYLTVLNSMYWLYGYISDNSGQQSKNEPTSIVRQTYLNQGGLCYQPGINPAKFSVTRYDPFKLIWNPKYENPLAYTRRKFPLTDTSLIKIDDYWYHNWSTAQHSYLVQNLGANPRPITTDLRIPYIGANCVMLPFESFILEKIVKAYIAADDCQYGTSYNENPWLFTFADYVKDNFVTSNTLITLTYNKIIKRLLRCHISFPYNNVLSTNFINSVHFMWARKSVPTTSESSQWNDVILPQYIFSNSPAEKHFKSIGLKKIDMYNPPAKVTLDTSYKAIDIEFKQCNHTNLDDIVTGEVSTFRQNNSEKKDEKK